MIKDNNELRRGKKFETEKYGTVKIIELNERLKAIDRSGNRDVDVLVKFNTKPERDAVERRHIRQTTFSEFYKLVRDNPVRD